MLNEDMDIHSTNRMTAVAQPELRKRNTDMSMMAERKKLALARPDLLQEGAFIDGEWTGAASSIDVYNPATGRLLGQVPALGKA